MNKKIDLIILFFYFIIGAAFCYIFKINAFGSILVFFGLPSLYLTIRNPKYIKKSIIFSFILGVPMIILIDYIAHLTGQWIIPHSILPYRLFTYVSVEVIFWAILNVYSVVIFYEYFLNHRSTDKVWLPHMKYLLSFVSFLFVLFLIFYYFLPNLLHIPYFYLMFGIFWIFIPLLIHFILHPNFLGRFLEVAAYFFYVTFLYEIVALKVGWWDFPGKQFVGWIHIFNVKFPIEELVFWLLLFAMIVLAIYEYFDDDEK